MRSFNFEQYHKNVFHNTYIADGVPMAQPHCMTNSIFIVSSTPFTWNVYNGDEK